MHRVFVVAGSLLLLAAGPPPLPPGIAPHPAEPYDGYIEPRHMTPHYPHHYYYHRPVHHHPLPAPPRSK